MSDLEVFEGVGYETTEGGVLVLRTKRFSYYGPGDGSQLPEFSVYFKSIKNVSRNGTKIEIAAKNKFFQFTLAGKSDARGVTDKIDARILARKRRKEVEELERKSTEESEPSFLMAPEPPPSPLLVPEPPPEPECLVPNINSSSGAGYPDKEDCDSRLEQIKDKTKSDPGSTESEDSDSDPDDSGE